MTTYADINSINSKIHTYNLKDPAKSDLLSSGGIKRAILFFAFGKAVLLIG